MVTSQYDPSSNTQNIVLAERFDFSIQREFREAYSHTQKAQTVFKVDLSATENIDSAALGMLLALDDHAKKFNSRVLLHNPSGAALQILRAATSIIFSMLNRKL